MGSLHSNDTCSGSLNSFIREPNKTASPNFVETRYQQVVGLCWWVSRHWARQLELGAEMGLSLAVVAVVYWTTPGIEQQAAKPFPRRRRLKMSKKQITLWGTSTPNQNCRQPTRPFPTKGAIPPEQEPAGAKDETHLPNEHDRAVLRWTPASSRYVWNKQFLK